MIAYGQCHLPNVGLGCKCLPSCSLLTLGHPYQDWQHEQAKPNLAVKCWDLVTEAWGQITEQVKQPKLAYASLTSQANQLDGPAWAKFKVNLSFSTGRQNIFGIQQNLPQLTMVSGQGGSHPHPQTHGALKIGQLHKKPYGILATINIHIKSTAHLWFFDSLFQKTS